MPFSMYMRKEKARANKDKAILHKLLRDPLTKPTKLEMLNLKDKTLEHWSAHDLRRMQ